MGSIINLKDMRIATGEEPRNLTKRPAQSGHPAWAARRGSAGKDPQSREAVRDRSEGGGKALEEGQCHRSASDGEIGRVVIPRSREAMNRVLVCRPASPGHSSSRKTPVRHKLVRC